MNLRKFLTVILSSLFCITITQGINAQDNLVTIDSIADKTNTKSKVSLTEAISKNKDSIKAEQKIFFGADFTNRYIWRGQSYGGHFFAIQPFIDYYISDKLMIEVWATTNFKEDVYLHNQYGLKGYKELELYVDYTINNYLTLSLHDYYSPIKGHEEEVYNNNYFYYGESSAKLIDLNINFDFAEKGVPVSGILSTFVAGNDYRYDVNVENPKQNFTTYLELTYTFADFFENFELMPTAGVVFNNAAEAYVNADYDKPSLINLRLDAIKTFKLSNNFNIPVTLSYIHNAATKNVDFSGRNFFQASLTLEY